MSKNYIPPPDAKATGESRKMPCSSSICKGKWRWHYLRAAGFFD